MTRRQRAAVVVGAVAAVLLAVGFGLRPTPVPGPLPPPIAEAAFVVLLEDVHARTPVTAGVAVEFARRAAAGGRLQWRTYDKDLESAGPLVAAAERAGVDLPAWLLIGPAPEYEVLHVEPVESLAAVDGRLRELVGPDAVPGG